MGREIAVSLMMLFLGIGVLVVIHVCIVRRAFRGDNNNDNGEGEGEEGESSSGMKRRMFGELKNLPCFDYEEQERGCSLVDCAVCLENFKVGDVCRLLPNCNHSFHVHCIDLWILNTPVCPICRTWVMLPSVSDTVQIEMA
ncbi:hypothetical protein VNO77_09422 [Canavalia gladiata]|uniref:RING-type E3 ubiquitin transferase n=1 Tax=Canavalia gladiata TaxID=3824 RepID=A0AAN9MEQ1_CANGL